MTRDEFRYSVARYDHWIKLRDAWIGPVLAALVFALFRHARLALVVFAFAAVWWGFAELRRRYWCRRWGQGVTHDR